MSTIKDKNIKIVSVTKKKKPVNIPEDYKVSKTDKIIPIKKTLVIVESPGKISKIQSYLGNNYVVKASYGHILKINPNGMNINFNTFEPNYVKCPEKEKNIKDLKAEYKKAGDLLIATDLDREGEMIAWSVADILGVKNPKRIVFNDITEKSIRTAVSSPGVINYDMVNAQKCRTMLDKIIGYDLSSLIRSNISDAKSAGRVQSVVVRLIVDKETEISEYFNSDQSSYYKTIGLFDKSIKGILYSSKKVDKSDYTTILDFFKKVKTAVFTVGEIFTTNSTIKPLPPFTTATLQQESSKRFCMNAKVTMQVAQKLYESGFITYMRTDSTNLSEEALQDIHKYILSVYGTQYYKLMRYQTSELAQEAHEAIRVTDVNLISINTIGNYTDYEIKLYDLIWKRTIACQMAPALFNIHNIHINISNMKKYFLSQTKQCVFDGFMVVYSSTDTEDELDKPANLKINQILTVSHIISEETFKSPPARYNEASLINKLDVKNLNIGRPSTYAGILDKITDRKYVDIKNIEGISKDINILKYENNELSTTKKKIQIGKEDKKLVPTKLGIMVTEYLVSKFLEIMEYKFTADMEASLDSIAMSKINWLNYMKVFHRSFAKLVNENKILKDDKNIIGSNLNFKYYKTVTKYGAAIKRVDDNNEITFYSIKSPYSIETITLEDAIEISKYPMLIGEYDNSKIMLKKGPTSLYFTWNDNNYSLPKLEDREPNLSEYIQVIQESLSKTFVVDNITYYLRKGPYGNYLSYKKNKTAKYVNISVPTKIDIVTDDNIKDIIASHKTKPYKKFIKVKPPTKKIDKK